MDIKEYIDNQRQDVLSKLTYMCDYERIREEEKRLQAYLKTKYNYYDDNDICKIVNDNIVPGKWYDRKEFGDPNIYHDDFLILVRYYEYSSYNTLKANIVVDHGSYDGTIWIIDNDWCECGMGTEILAYMLYPEPNDVEKLLGIEYETPTFSYNEIERTKKGESSN